MPTRQEGEAPHSQRDSQLMKGAPGGFTQQLGSSACNSVILSLISGQSDLQAALGNVMCFEDCDGQTLRVVLSVATEPLPWKTFDMGLVFYIFSLLSAPS